MFGTELSGWCNEEKEKKKKKRTLDSDGCVSECRDQRARSLSQALSAPSGGGGAVVMGVGGSAVVLTVRAWC